MTTGTADPYPAVAPASTSTAGRASLIIAIVIVVAGVAQQVINYFVPLMMANLALGSGDIGIVFGIFGAIIGILAIVGLILGIIGLGDRTSSRAAAGAGTAIAASSLLSVILGFLLPLIISALY